MFRSDLPTNNPNHHRMKNFRLFFTVAFAAAVVPAFAQSAGRSAGQEFTGAAAAQICSGSSRVLINAQSRVPSFIVYSKGTSIPASGIFESLRKPLQMQMADGWKLKHAQKDNMGFTHYRYTQTYNGVPVEKGEYLVHERNGRVESVNGMWMDGITVNTNPALNEAAAFSAAKNFIGAALYKWEIPAEETQLQLVQNDPAATWLPKGELVIVCRNNDIYKKEYHLAWKFDIYAAQPFSRNYVFVDAQDGSILYSQNRIWEADVAATGTTRYSGTQSFTCDNYGSGQYRLRETARGQGIQTFNAHNSTNTAGATDFTNTTATWTSTANGDDCARDAHWGAEKTYDYYSMLHSRNGLDDNGLLMVSYVHYDSQLNNAYWDGNSMNYGDGTGSPGGFNPLVAIDVCGHEFTHGVTQFTANLDYQDESGALNESYSDIFGTAIEFYAKPASADYLIGEEITVNANTALRNMQNPNQYGDPDTYTGTNWYTGTADNGGVHTNSGVQNRWFYVLSAGASGTNDLGNPFNVTGIGVTNAADVAFRCLTVYLVSTSQYADACTYSIQAANDLFGACSPEVIATTDAWYSVGVGSAFSATVNATFTADVASSCNLPLTVNFTNTSSNASNATWYFGDNTTSTVFNPSHTYTQPGTYNVALSVNSACGADSTIQSSAITINTPAAPVSADQSSCSNASFPLSATGSGTLNWYTAATGGTPVATGGNYTTPVLSNTTTYYVENQVAQAPGNVGPASTSFGTGGQHNNTSTQYLEFTVLQNCTLTTALVNAGSSGNKTFILWDSQGNQLNQYVVNVPGTGNQTVTLNIPLTPGNYRIGGTQMNLYRNNSGTNYPYTFNNVVSITGSSAGASYYYYLYNWTITLPPCTSVRTPVTCFVGSPVINFASLPYDTVCTITSPFALTGGSPAGGTYSGPGVSGGMFDPAAAGVGLQTITYSYTDSSNCTGTATQDIYVDVCTGISGVTPASGINVYPNPASSQLMIDLSLERGQNVSVRLINLLGEIVYASQSEQGSGSSTIEINTASLPRGVYLLELQTETGRQLRKIELQ